MLHTSVNSIRRPFARATHSVDARTFGFDSLAEYALAVRAASIPSAAPDMRLVRAAATTYGNESSGPDGGFAVPIAYAEEIISALGSEDSILSRCRTLPTRNNSLGVPVDQTPPWSSAGVAADWEGEGLVGSQSKPKLDFQQYRLARLKALVPVSDELDQDANALSAYLTWKFSDAVLWKANDAIINGLGTGMPLGILHAPGTIVVAKETSQAATTINTANLRAMRRRLLSSSQARAVWLCNPDSLDTLEALLMDTGAPAYIPNNGTIGAPGGYLMGRPVIFTEACQPIGSVGDIVLGDLSGYLAVLREGGPQIDVSMHLWFDQDMSAYRLLFRMAGQPLLSEPVTPPNSSVTRSHFVALEART